MNRNDPVLKALKSALGAFERNDAIDWGEIEKAIAIAEQQQRVVEAARSLDNDEVYAAGRLHKELSTLDEMMK